MCLQICGNYKQRFSYIKAEVGAKNEFSFYFLADGESDLSIQHCVWCAVGGIGGGGWQVGGNADITLPAW